MLTVSTVLPSSHFPDYDEAEDDSPNPQHRESTAKDDVLKSTPVLLTEALLNQSLMGYTDI